MLAIRIELTLVATLLWLSVATAAAASEGLPNSIVSTDATVIGCQVREAIVLGERAKARLESSGSSDDPAATHKLLDTMYRQVRMALGNLKDRKARLKTPDPMLDLQEAKVTLAWHTIRRPVDTFFDSPAKDEWVGLAARELQAAMSALRQAEVLLPWCANARRASRRDPDS
jgi:hypothetical protein